MKLIYGSDDFLVPVACVIHEGIDVEEVKRLDFVKDAIFNFEIVNDEIFEGVTTVQLRRHR